MNHPLKFDSYTLYQAGYQLDEFTSMSFKVYDLEDEDQESLGTFKIDLTDTESEYEFDNGMKVVLDQVFPDYYLDRSEEHTSELQSRGHLVCRLLLEKKKQ